MFTPILILQDRDQQAVAIRLQGSEIVSRIEPIRSQEGSALNHNHIRDGKRPSDRMSEGHLYKR